MDGVPWEVFGQLGVVALALIAGQWMTLRWVAIPERERSGRLENEVQRLNGVIQERAVPALVEATRAVADATQALRERETKARLRDRG